MERDPRVEQTSGGHWVDAGAFARFAEDDLRRWRPAIGCSIEPADERWGMGVVDQVLWASPCEGIESFVQVRGRYATGGTVTGRAKTWALHHRRIRVCDELLDAIAACSDAALSPDEQAQCRERYAARFQQQHDERKLERVARLRRTAGDDQGIGDTVR